MDSTANTYPGAGANSLQALMGFFLERQGQYGIFLYDDPTDSAVINGAIAPGDGSTTTFTFIRYMGAFSEPVGWVTSVSNVYLNGVNQASGFDAQLAGVRLCAGFRRRDFGDLRLRLPMSL
jgi:hypothetical protein